MKLLSIVFSYLLLLMSTLLNGQTPWRSHASFEYGIQFPIADLSDRFGRNNRLGASFEFLNTESKWILGFGGGYLFGIEVKEDVLEPLRTAEGDIIGNDRTPADVGLRERGFYAGLHAGRILPFDSEKPLQGIKLLAGGGFLQHKIRVQDNSRTVTQLTGDYLKGYDRLTNGFALSLFAGYQHYDDYRNVHFYAGLDLHWGITQNRRSYNFDTMTADTETRSDGMIGLRIGWILPIGKGTSENEIFY